MLTFDGAAEFSATSNSEAYDEFELLANEQFHGDAQIVEPREPVDLGDGMMEASGLIYVTRDWFIPHLDRDTLDSALGELLSSVNNPLVTSRGNGTLTCHGEVEVTADSHTVRSVVEQEVIRDLGEEPVDVVLGDYSALSSTPNGVRYFAEVQFTLGTGAGRSLVMDAIPDTDYLRACDILDEWLEFYLT